MVWWCLALFAQFLCAASCRELIPYERAKEGTWDSEVMPALYRLAIQGYTSPLFHQTAPAMSMSFSPSGTRLAVGSSQGVRLWYLVDGQWLYHQRLVMSYPVRRLAWSAETMLAVAAEDMVVVWHEKEAQEWFVQIYKQHRAYRKICYIGFHSTKDQLLLATDTGAISVAIDGASWCKQGSCPIVGLLGQDKLFSATDDHIAYIHAGMPCICRFAAVTKVRTWLTCLSDEQVRGLIMKIYREGICLEKTCALSFTEYNVLKIAMPEELFSLLQAFIELPHLTSDTVEILLSRLYHLELRRGSKHGL